MVDESTQEHPNGGFYIKTDNHSMIGYDNKNNVTLYPPNTDVNTFNGIPYEDANKKDIFEKIMRLRNQAGWWAYKHGFPFYGKKLYSGRKYDPKELADYGKQIRAKYIGQESWYDEDNFFWIKFDNFDDYVAAQLRISNHNAKHETFYESHYKPDDIKCDVVLNLMIGGINNRMGMTYSPSTDGSVVSIDAVYDAGDNELYDDELEAHLNNKENWTEDDKSLHQRRLWVNDFIKDVLSGTQRKITMDDIRKYIDPNPIITASMHGMEIPLSAKKIRPEQFLAAGGRSNILRSRSKVPKWTVAKQQQANVVDGRNLVSIGSDGIFEKNGDLYQVFKDNTTNKYYALDIEHNFAYREKTAFENARLGAANNKKKGGRVRTANVENAPIEDRFVIDPNQGIQVVNNNSIVENYRRKVIIRLTESELNRIIGYCVRSILKG